MIHSSVHSSIRSSIHSFIYSFFRPHQSIIHSFFHSYISVSHLFTLKASATGETVLMVPSFGAKWDNSVSRSCKKKKETVCCNSHLHIRQKKTQFIMGSFYEWFYFLLLFTQVSLLAFKKKKKIFLSRLSCHEIVRYMVSSYIFDLKQPFYAPSLKNSLISIFLCFEHPIRVIYWWDLGTHE